MTTTRMQKETQFYAAPLGTLRFDSNEPLSFLLGWFAKKVLYELYGYFKSRIPRRFFQRPFKTAIYFEQMLLQQKKLLGLM